MILQKTKNLFKKSKTEFKRKGKGREAKERDGKGKEREGKEQKGKEREGKEREGKERMDLYLFVRVPLRPYHFVRTTSSVPLRPYHFVRATSSVPLRPLHFVRPWGPLLLILGVVPKHSFFRHTCITTRPSVLNYEIQALPDHLSLC